MSLRSWPVPERSRAAQEGLGSPQLSWSFALAAGLAGGKIFAVGINTGTRAQRSPAASFLHPPCVSRTPAPRARGGWFGILSSARCTRKRLGCDQVHSAFKTWEDTAKGLAFRKSPVPAPSATSPQATGHL